MTVIRIRITNNDRKGDVNDNNDINKIVIVIMMILMTVPSITTLLMLIMTIIMITKIYDNNTEMIIIATKRTTYVPRNLAICAIFRLDCAIYRSYNCAAISKSRRVIKLLWPSVI